MVIPPLYCLYQLLTQILFLAAKGVMISELQLPWSKLPKQTADNGLSIVNWPDLVPFPGEKKKSTGVGKTSKMQTSIKVLNVSELSALLTAFHDPATAPQLLKMNSECMYSTH